MNEALIPIGVITNTFGIKGAIRIKTYSGEGTCLSPGFYIFVEKVSGSLERLKIRRSKPFKDFFIVELDEVEDANQAESLVKSKVYVKKEDLPQLKEDEYYWIDLLGCNVFGIDGRFIGELKNIIETGGTDVFEIVDKDKEILVPFTKKFVLNIDLKKKEIIIDAEPFLP